MLVSTSLSYAQDFVISVKSSEKLMRIKNASGDVVGSSKSAFGGSAFLDNRGRQFIGLQYASGVMPRSSVQASYDSNDCTGAPYVVSGNPISSLYANPDTNSNVILYADHTVLLGPKTRNSYRSNGICIPNVNSFTNTFPLYECTDCNFDSTTIFTFSYE